MTARQLLDIGASKIDASLSDAPAAKLRMLKTLGDLDRFTVKPADAGTVSLTALQCSIQTAKAQLALNDASSVIATLTPTRDEIARSPLRPYLKSYEADTLLLTGKARLLLGQPAVARPDLERALSFFLDLYDPTRSPDVADAQVALARSLAGSGRLAEALVLARSAKRIQAVHRELSEQYREPLRELERLLARMPASRQ
jgi:hypothetical protein